MTEWKLQRWERNTIVDVQGKKVRVMGRQLMPYWGLVLRFSSGPEMVILQGPPRQMASLARHLRSSLGITEEEVPAMKIPLPPGCRYKRARYGDGVMIRVPPRGERAINYAIACVWGAMAIAGYLGLRMIQLDAPLYQWDWERAAGTAVMLLVVGGLLGYVTWYAVKKSRRTLHVFAGPQNTFVVEASLFRPITVGWRGEQLADVSVAGTADGRSALRFTPRTGQPLLVAEGQPEEYLQWVASVLNTARPAEAAVASAASATQPLSAQS
jgi:hypothetical protein